MKSSESKVTRSERVPRADKLYLLRDIIHLLDDLGGIAGKRTMFNRTKKTIATSENNFSEKSTFDDYLSIGAKLGLMEVTSSALKMLDSGSKLAGISEFSEPHINGTERSFFRSILLSYSPFRLFLSLGFCKGKAILVEEQLYDNASCPTRETLLTAYMRRQRQNTDREVRTLLGWGVQTGLIELDEYSGRYFLVREQEIEAEIFLKILKEAYRDVKDNRTKVAIIPEVRFRCCCLHNLSRRLWDRFLLLLYDSQPSVVQLGKGSTSRDEVTRFGVKGKTFYYYYMNIRDQGI